MKQNSKELMMLSIVALFAIVGIMIMASSSSGHRNKINVGGISGSAILSDVEEGKDKFYKESEAVYSRMTYTEPYPGLFNSPIEVEIFSMNPDAIILYTLDGSDPLTYGEIYSGPIKIFKDTDIKAVAYEDNLMPSTIMLARFFIRP